MKRLIGSILAIAMLGAHPAGASEVDVLAEKASALFRYEVGTWESRWERLDAEGNVVAVMEGTETFTPTLDDTALSLETRVQGQQHWSQAIKFYSPREQRIVFIDVSSSGAYYVMTQDVETEIVSGESRAADGSSSLFRFVITRKTEGQQDVVMEMSGDDGETWRKVTNQFMRRVR